MIVMLCEIPISEKFIYLHHQSWDIQQHILHSIRTVMNERQESLPTFADIFAIIANTIFDCHFEAT